MITKLMPSLFVLSTLTVSKLPLVSANAPCLLAILPCRKATTRQWALCLPMGNMRQKATTRRKATTCQWALCLPMGTMRRKATTRQCLFVITSQWALCAERQPRANGHSVYLFSCVIFSFVFCRFSQLCNALNTKLLPSTLSTDHRHCTRTPHHTPPSNSAKLHSHHSTPSLCLLFCQPITATVQELRITLRQLILPRSILTTRHQALAFRSVS